MFNKKVLLCLVSLLAWMIHSPALAKTPKIAVTLGEVRSPVLQSVAAKRPARDGRAMARAAVAEVSHKLAAGEDHREAAKRVIQRELAGADVIAADLAELSLTPEDRLVVEAAMESGVPIAFENVEKDKMALLLPMGADADLIVLESAAGGSRSHLHLWKEGLDTLIERPETSVTVRVNGGTATGPGARQGNGREAVKGGSPELLKGLFRPRGQLRRFHHENDRSHLMVRGEYTGAAQGLLAVSLEPGR